MSYTLGKKVVEDEDGVWKDFAGAKLLIRRAGTVAFLKIQESLEKPYRKKIDRGTLPVKIKRDINLTAVANALLVDWKGVQDEKKKDVAYTEEIGKQALMDDPELLEFVMDIALDNENFFIERGKEIAKKSTKQ